MSMPAPASRIDTRTRSSRMKRPNVFARLLLVGLGAMAALPAYAGNDTGEESAIAEVESQRAPLTLSADGRWRLHVDARNELHRVEVADPKREQRMTLPAPGLRLAASRTGQRVAFTTRSACVGLVDFGAAASSTTTFTWLPSARPVRPQDVPAPSPGMPPDAACGGTSMEGQPIALSTDGRWLATPWQVYDIDRKTVIATLPEARNPVGGRRVLQVQFVDNDTKLLMRTATLGEGDESLDTPSDLQFAVWDLKRKGLFNLISLNQTSLSITQSFLADYSAETGALYWVDPGRYLEAQRSSHEGDAAVPLELMQSRPGACHSRAVSRFPLTAWDWSSLLVDPLGRWVAGVHKLDPTHGEATSVADHVSELLILDIDTQRQIARHALPDGMIGLVATHDGSRIFGLTPRPIDPKTGVPAAAGVGPVGGGELVEIDVDLGQVTTPKLSAVAWDAAPCTVEDETASARTVRHESRLLRPLWEQPLESLDQLRRQVQEEGRPGAVLESEAPSACKEPDPTRSSFVMVDETVWVDRLSKIAQLDTATGRALRTLPTPRSATVCSIPSPAARGFVNHQGDTLSWRPFDGAASGATARQVIDVRPGWYVSDMRSEARQIVAIWRAKPGTATAKDKNDQVMDVAIATYDAVHRKPIGDRPTNADAYDMVGDPGDPEFDRFLSPCHDTAGPLTSGYDWHVSYFDSFRAYACAPAGAAMSTVLWSHFDIAPKLGPAPPLEEPHERRAWVVSGPIGVFQDDATMRAFDVSSRREIAQVALAGAPQAVWWLPGEGVADRVVRQAVGISDAARLRTGLI